LKLTISLTTLFLLFVLAVNAQTSYSIKGAVADTSEKIKLVNTTIMVINAKDSVLRKFTRPANDGSFSISNLPKGNYIAVFSLKDYVDYSEAFTLDDAKKSHDFGTVNLQLTSRLLHDVIIKGEVTAIKIKGDTTEFNARAYVIQPNDRVEDLIKQFPGIEVDKDGKITAQGQTVNKVLVDGEEFFGDDPTLVTKNIRADMVDKVQLYDKKSDQAAFTGIDDGVKIKTLNIKLKEDKKNGYFGKVDAGVGNDGFYQGQVLFNKFNGKKKIAAYTTDANTGKTGLSFQDNQKYADDGSVNYDDNGGISVTLNDYTDLDSFSGRYNNRGIPLARTGGLHYDSKWNDDKQSINGNYKAGSLQVDGTSNTLTQNNLPTGITNTSSDQKFGNFLFREKIDATYLVKPDTSTSLKIAVDGTTKNTRTDNDYLTITRRANDTLQNRNARSSNYTGTQQLFNASVFFTKKLKKQGRTLSVLLNTSFSNSNNSGYSKSDIDFYNKLGSLDSSQIVDQRKTSMSRNTVVNSNITYTEPISKNLALILNYGATINNGSSDLESYNQSTPGNYDVRVPAFSNFLKLNQFSNQGGAMFYYKKGKVTISGGTKATDVTFKQIDENTGDVFKRNFINWSPQAFMQYKISLQQSWSINYWGNTTQPAIYQLQPVKQNADPLNITIGNPDLKPAFSNRFSVYYNTYKVLTGQSFYINVSFGNTSNQIINNRITDSAGKNTTQYVNLTSKDPYNYSLYTSFSRKITGPGITVGINANVYGNVYYNYINSVLNATTSATYSGGLSISKYVQKKYDFSISLNPNYSINKTSLQNINSNGGGFTGRGNFNVYLPLKFQIASDVNYTYTAKTQAFSNDLKRTIWNATLSKVFLKGNNLKLSLSGNDLLNQNQGFDRYAYGGTITQSSYTTIKRYFMLSITWDFNKMGGTDTKK